MVRVASPGPELRILRAGALAGCEPGHPITHSGLPLRLSVGATEHRKRDRPAPPQKRPYSEGEGDGSGGMIAGSGSRRARSSWQWEICRSRRSCLDDRLGIWRTRVYYLNATSFERETVLREVNAVCNSDAKHTVNGAGGVCGGKKMLRRSASPIYLYLTAS